MPLKRNAEQKVDEVMAETGPPKARSWGINHFHVVGRMTADPQLRYTPTGKAVLHFGIATTAAGNTVFLDLVAWERSGEVIATYGAKGRELYAEGRISTRVREIEGRRVKQVDLVVETFQLLGRPPSGVQPTDETVADGAA
jgi:single-strand DNA-binding protein